MYSSVYEITFPDGSRYVGKSKYPQKRKNQHLLNSSNTPLREKINQFGKKSACFNIIEKDISEGVAELVEKLEIKNTPEKHRLNINSVNWNFMLLNSIDAVKEFYNESRKDSDQDLIKALKKCRKALISSFPLYKSDDKIIDKRNDMIDRLEQLMNYLNLTVELKEK